MRTVMVWVGLALGQVGCMEAHSVTTDSGAPDAFAAPDTALEIDAGATDGGVSVDGGEAIRDAPSDAPVPSFDTIYESILVPRCARCHIDEAPESSSYQPRMTDVDIAYAALFDVPAETSWVRGCVPDGVTAYRVRPRDLTASMLAFLPTCYVRDADHDELTDDELAEIQAWIAGGAPRSSF